MSLILEALKKSEQQRRLGDAPTLGSPALASRRRRSALPVIAALIVLAVGAGWWLLRKPVPPAIPAPVAQTGPAPAGTAPAMAPATNANPHAKRAVPPAPVAKLAPAATGNPLVANKPAASAGNAGRAPTRANLPLGDRPGSVAQLPPALPAVAGPTAAAPLTQKAKQAPPPNAAATAKPAIAAAKPEAKPPIVETKTETKSAAADEAKPDRGTAKTAAVPAPRKPQAPILPSVWELSYAIRKDLPAMSVTMHVYADDPAQRFIVIKGERHVEGDTIADGVTLRQIRPDGMELDFKGTRFTFPRDGR